MDPTVLMSDAYQSTLEFVRQYTSPIIGAIGVVFGSLLTFISARFQTDSNERIARTRQFLTSHRASMFASVQMTEAQTAQFQALLSGYQRHVEQLSHEVNSLRDEVAKLRTMLALRVTVCGECDKFLDWHLGLADKPEVLNDPAL